MSHFQKVLALSVFALFTRSALLLFHSNSPSVHTEYLICLFNRNHHKENKTIYVIKLGLTFNRGSRKRNTPLTGGRLKLTNMRTLSILFETANSQHADLFFKKCEWVTQILFLKKKKYAKSHKSVVVSWVSGIVFFFKNPPFHKTFARPFRVFCSINCKKKNVFTWFLMCDAKIYTKHEMRIGTHSHSGTEGI